MNLNKLSGAMKAAESCIETPSDLTKDEIGFVLVDLRAAIEVVEAEMDRIMHVQA